MILGQVWPRRNVLGWSEDDPSGDTYPTVDTDALFKIYDTDAHFVPYYLETEEDDRCPRLLKSCPDDWPVRFQVVPLDCEPEGHQPDEAWREHFRAVVDELGWARYETRGGGRALFGVAEPLDRSSFVVVQRRGARLLTDRGVRVDPATLGQWGRCYRLPFVTRDGEQQRHFSRLLDKFPAVELDALPTLVGQGPYAGIGDTPLPWRAAGNVGEGGRNSYLVRAAGGLRRQGLGGTTLLEELARLNEARCNPPLPFAEVAVVARSAEQWEAGARRTEPEPVEDDQPLALGDQVEVARRLLAELPADTVGDQGALWSYNEGLGIWAPKEGAELARLTARYSGWPIRNGNDREGNPRFLPLKVGDPFAKGTAAVMLREHRSPGFFDHEEPGVAFANGFVGVEGALRAHSAEHRARVAVPFDFAPGGLPGAFLGFLRGIWRDLEDAEGLIRLIREIIGVYACGLATDYQRAFIFLGVGSNGKSVLLDVVRSLFPRGASTAISPQEWGQEYRRARLATARINLVSEMPEVEIMSSEKVKGIISGDVTEGRAIYSEPFDFQPKAGHLFSANALPGVRDHSHGFWRRWTVVPFPRTFLEHEQDRGLTGRLVETQRGLILSWAVEAVPGVVEAGGYAIPESCEEATRGWRARADQIACFVDEDEVVNSPGWRLSGSQLYNRYVDWARLNGYRAQLSARVFGERIKQMPGVGSSRTGRGVDYFGV